MSTTIRTSMQKNGLMLAIFAVVTTGLISLTYFGTRDQIALQQQQKLLSILNAVIDESSYDNAIHSDCILVTSELLGSNEPQHIYRATLMGQAVAVAIETTAPDGYSGKIQLVVGLSSSAEGEVTITGVRVLEHKETPGLGDKIDLRISDWILGFEQQLYSADRESVWSVKKDGGQFDQFTGATITPRAVVKAVKASAEYYIANQDSIFNGEDSCASSSNQQSN